MGGQKKVAVVTGAAQGIGRRTAELLAERGYILILNDLRTPSDTLQAIHSRGGEALEFVGDINGCEPIHGKIWQDLVSFP